MSDKIKKQHNFKGLISLVLFFIGIAFLIPIFFLNNNSYYCKTVNDIASGEIKYRSVGLKINYQNQENYNNQYPIDLNQYLTFQKENNDFLCVVKKGEQANESCGDYVVAYKPTLKEYQVDYCVIINYKKNGEFYDPRTVYSAFKNIGNILFNVFLSLSISILFLSLLFFVLFLLKRNRLHKNS